jgi:hypothetical protein
MGLDIARPKIPKTMFIALVNLTIRAEAGVFKILLVLHVYLPGQRSEHVTVSRRRLIVQEIPTVFGEILSIT